MTLPEQKSPPPPVFQPTLPLEMPRQTARQELKQDTSPESPTASAEVDTGQWETCEPKEAWTTLDQAARERFQKGWTAVMREVAANDRSR